MLNADFEPTKTELKKLTQELKGNIHSIDENVKYLQCLKRNLCEELNLKKNENDIILHNKSNDWEDSAYLIRLRSQISSINSIIKHKKKLEIKLKELVNKRWKFDDTTKINHIHKLVLEKQKLKASIEIMNKFLCEFENDDLLESISENNNIYHNKLQKSYRKQIYIKSKCKQSFENIYDQIDELYQIIYHYEQLFDLSLKFAINKSINKGKKNYNSFVELAGFDKMSELQMILIRIQNILKSMWSNLLLFKQIAQKLNDYLPIQYIDNNDDDIDNNDDEEKQQQEMEKISQKKLNDMIKNELLDNESWDTLKTSKYFESMIEKCVEHIYSSSCNHHKENKIKLDMDKIYIHCDKIMLYLLYSIRNGFNNKNIDINIEPTIKIFINWCESIGLFENKNWINILFELREILLSEFFRYFDDFSDFFRYFNGVKSAWIHCSRLILLHIYDLCGVKEDISCIYQKILPSLKNQLVTNTKNVDISDDLMIEFDDNDKIKIENKCISNKEKNKSIWSVPKMNMDKFDDLEYIESNNNNNNNTFNYGQQLWRTWKHCNKLTQEYEEFCEKLKLRDPKSFKQIIEPYSNKMFTGVQLGRSIINIWDKAFNHIRYFNNYNNNNNQKQEKQEIICNKIKSLGLIYRDYQIDRSSFDSAGLLLLEMVIKQHGNGKKWHERNQKAWVWSLEIINDLLYKGANHDH